MSRAWYTAQAFNNGGVTLVRARGWTCVMAKRSSAGVVAGNSDQMSAIAPATKGAAALVPPSVSGISLTTDARDLLARGEHAAPPDRMA